MASSVQLWHFLCLAQQGVKQPIELPVIWDAMALMWRQCDHYIDVIMSTIASQITSLTVVYSIFYSGADQRNIKAPRHWPFCGEFTGTGEFPAQRASNAKNVSIWWRHHDVTHTMSFRPVGGPESWEWYECALWDLLHKSRNVTVPHPTMNHFVTEFAHMCTFLLDGVLWDICLMHFGIFEMGLLCDYWLQT